MPARLRLYVAQSRKIASASARLSGPQAHRKMAKSFQHKTQSSASCGRRDDRTVGAPYRSVELDLNAPARIVQRRNGDTVAVFPVAVAVGEIPGLQFAEKVSPRVHHDLMLTAHVRQGHQAAETRLLPRSDERVIRPRRSQRSPNGPPFGRCGCVCGAGKSRSRGCVADIAGASAS
jgi:hypothetical protein